MAVILVLLAIASGVVLVLVAVVKVKEARESKKRRTVATPYGVLMAPTDAELRRTREDHPSYSVYCPVCEGDSKLTSTCKYCDGVGTIPINLSEEEGLKNGG